VKYFVQPLDSPMKLIRTRVSLTVSENFELNQRLSGVIFQRARNPHESSESKQAVNNQGLVKKFLLDIADAIAFCATHFLQLQPDWKRSQAE
jgi:hypothetical protein